MSKFTFHIQIMLAYEHSNVFAHLWNNRLSSPDFFLSVSVLVPFFLLTIAQGPKRSRCVSFQRTNLDAFLTFTVLSTSVLFDMKQFYSFLLFISYLLPSVLLLSAQNKDENGSRITWQSIARCCLEVLRDP